MKEKNSAPKQNSITQYRDNIIRKLCKDESRAVELCNAITGSNYTEDAKVKMYDLEDSLHWRYNDVAFAIEDELLVMIEHSTIVSQNMPIRLLSYATDIIYAWHVVVEKFYRGKIIKIPTPKFYMLYNGSDPLKEKTLKLSASFETDGGENSLELVVHVIDINYTSGHEVLNKSESLRGYAYLIEQINIYKKQGLTRDKAIKAAVNHCIESNILADFLKEHYEEVANMLNLQYDKEEEFNAIREDTMEEFATSMLADNLPLSFISKHTGLSIEELEKLVDEEGLKITLQESGMLNLQYDKEAEFDAIREDTREESIEEAQEGFAKSMLADNFPLSTISKHTGLSVKELEKLVDEAGLEKPLQVSVVLKPQSDKEAEFDAIREDTREEAKEDFAKSMLADNLQLSLISKHTGLSIEELEKLADKSGFEISLQEGGALKQQYDQDQELKN